MKIVPALILALLPLFTLIDAKFHDRKIFVSQYGGKTKSLTDLKHVRAQIRDQTLANLKSLPHAVKAELLHHADSAMKGHYPAITAVDFMEFFRNGNRGHFQTKLHQHRERISHLVVGHLLDSATNHTSMKYVNEIVNGVWMLLEQSTWCYPAHLGLQGTHDHLPTPGHNAIDLNAGEVAKILGWIKLLMHAEMDRVSPVVNKRIDHELRHRIFEDYLHTDFGWEGFHGSQHVVNNWNIWVNGNILKAAIFTLEDVRLFDAVLNKTLHSADYFLDGYGADGGCDEGPAYWRQAGGRLIEFLESVEQIFPGAKEYFGGLKLIRLIGEYSYKMRITSNWFVNFADAIPVIAYPPSLLYKYGELFNDDVMKQYAAFMMQFVDKPLKHSYFVHSMAGGDLNEFCNYVNTHKGIEAQSRQVAPELDTVWMPDIAVTSVRSKADAQSKFFLAAKAGNNHESHNHNDVGNFILFQDGHPVLIDIGVGTYTAKTFGKHRYDLFYMQSQYHNCPSINNVQQHDGSQYSAHNVTFVERPNGGGIHFAADIGKAYPKEAHVKHWVRSIDFNRDDNSVQIDDKYTLDKYLHPQQLHFIVPHDLMAEKTATGLRLRNSQVNVEATVDWSVLELKEELKSLDGDEHLTQVWGEAVKRLTLATKQGHSELSGHFTVKFSAGK